MQISQQAFERIVQENVAEFEMGLDEAIAEAVAQLKSQGVTDFSAVVTDPRQARDVSAAVAALTLDSSSSEEIDRQLTRLLQDLKNTPTLKTAAAQQGAVPALLGLISRLAPPETTTAASVDIHLTCLALKVLATLCSNHRENSDSVQEVGIRTLTRLAKFSYDNELFLMQECSLLSLRHSCTFHEQNKYYFVGLEGVNLLVQYLESKPQKMNVINQVAGLLKTLTVNDDAKSELSQTHDVIKSFVSAGVIKTTILLIKEVDHNPDVLCNWLIILKQFAVTEVNCKEIFDNHGIAIVESIFAKFVENEKLVKFCLLFFRNIAASDEYKLFLVHSCNVLKCILSSMKMYIDIVPIQEYSCGTIAALALRQPGNCSAIANLGGIAQIAFVLEVYMSKVINGNHQDPLLSKLANVIRQVGLAVRNLVARNPELRQIAIDERIDFYLVEAMKRNIYKDEAYAALRDLGYDIKKLNLLKNGKSSDYYSGTVACDKIALNFNPIDLESDELEKSIHQESRAPFPIQD